MRDVKGPNKAEAVARQRREWSIQATIIPAER